MTDDPIPGLPPLDDLLPPNDECYIPPTDLNELFVTGSPLFDLADVLKFERVGLDPAEYAAFRLGYTAGLFEVWLKSGKAFFMPVQQENVTRLMLRARAFRREVTYRNNTLFVSAHTD